jgi:hypothetical protein
VLAGKLKGMTLNPSSI